MQETELPKIKECALHAAALFEKMATLRAFQQAPCMPLWDIKGFAKDLTWQQLLTEINS